MRIAVFGASGTIGRLFIEIALKKGHDLNTYSRTPLNYSDERKIKQFIGDLSNEDKIKEAIIGVDAVVITLGPKLKFTYPGMPIATGHRNVIQAMKSQGVLRLITRRGRDSNPRSYWIFW